MKALNTGIARALVTGITGTLGTIVSRKLLEGGAEVIGYSRDELKQAHIQPHEGLTLYLGDVRDEKRLVEASRGCDLIFHFAALKHVDKLEENPEEAIQTNIYGTQNVLHAQRAHGIARVVLASTDKSAYPINAYGMSKGLAEKLVLRNPNNTVCRYGNVIASRGSAVGKFIETLKSKAPSVYLTDPNMIRFWLTQEEAADFVIENSLKPGPGGLRVPTLKAATVAEIAAATAKALGVTAYAQHTIGIRPGEKDSECLMTKYEGPEIHSHTAAKFNEGELLSMLKPIVEELRG